jgi:hypothetical protein
MLRRLFREPLVHFLLLGAVLFAIHQYRGGAGGAGPASRQIRLTADELSRLVLVFQAQWKRQPTVEEFGNLVESRVQEEVLYREALAMGLDKDDAIVKRRMAQKMQFLAEDVASAHEPTAEELRAWFERNQARFALPSRISFRHLYFSPDRRGTRARADAEAALAHLAGKPEDAKDAAGLADPFMFQNYYRDRAPDYVGKEFGPQFALAVAKLPAGAWSGPIESGFGWHLVFVDTVIPGRVPAFEEIEAEVKSAWLGEQKQRAWKEAYEGMRKKYSVYLPAAPGEKAPSPSSPASARPPGNAR